MASRPPFAEAPPTEDKRPLPPNPCLTCRKSLIWPNFSHLPTISLGTLYSDDPRCPIPTHNFVDLPALIETTREKHSQADTPLGEGNGEPDELEHLGDQDFHCAVRAVGIVRDTSFGVLKSAERDTILEDEREWQEELEDEAAGRKPRSRRTPIGAEVERRRKDLRGFCELSLWDQGIVGVRKSITTYGQVMESYGKNSVSGAGGGKAGDDWKEAQLHWDEEAREAWWTAGLLEVQEEEESADAQVPTQQ